MRKSIVVVLIFFYTTLYADTPIYQIDFQKGLDDKWRTLKAEGGYQPKVVRINGTRKKRLRLTDRKHDLSAAVTLDYEFPSTNNKFIMEFDYFAYGGCRDNDNWVESATGAGRWGADGMSIILFDSKVGMTPRVGASGGSLGYANGTIEMVDGSYKAQAGFEGGWLGIGLDEFGAFGVNDESRRDIDGKTLSIKDIEDNSEPNSIVLRGDESNGYRLLFKRHVKNALARESVKSNGKLKWNAWQSFKSGHYKLIVDSTTKNRIYITLWRDGSKIIDRLDITQYQQTIPEKFRIAFSSGTGGGCNRHEIDNVKIYGEGQVYTSEPTLVAVPDINQTEGDDGETEMTFTLHFDKPVPASVPGHEVGLWVTATDGVDAIPPL